MILARFMLGLSAIGGLVLSAAGCGPQEPPPDPPVAEAGNESGRSFKLEHTMARSVKVAPVQESLLPVILKAHGKFQFNEDRVVVILAPLSGHVRHLAARTGDLVQDGDALFEIDSRDVASAISDHLESHKDLDLAEKSYAMTKDLYEHQAASKISLQQSEIDLAKARGRVARNDAALRTLGVSSHSADAAQMTSLVPIHAPFAGTVTDRRVTEGQYVPADSTPLLTLADLSTVWILADVFERDLGQVRVGQKAEITTISYPGEKFTGTVARISDVVDPNSRTVKVRLVAANPDRRLKPEMFAAVSLHVREPEKALTVPERSVFTEGGDTFAFAQKGEMEFQRRRVEVSAAGEGRLRVTSGLLAGDTIVCEDVMLLRAQESSRDSR